LMLRRTREKPLLAAKNGQNPRAKSEVVRLKFYRISRNSSRTLNKNISRASTTSTKWFKNRPKNKMILSLQM
jgi:hypothetical protein